MLVPSVEHHPQRKEIVERILAGDSLRRIAATIEPKVHHATLARFRLSMIAPAVLTLRGKSEKSQAIQGLAAASGLEVQRAPEPEQAKENLRQFVQERVSSRLSRRTDWIGRAEDAPVFDPRTGKQVAKRMDHKALAAHDGNELKDLEFLSRLSGLLDGAADPSIKVRAVVVMPAGGEGTAAIELDIQR